MDKAHKWTDEQIEKLEKKLHREYSKAAREMKKRQKEYMRDFEIERKKRESLLDDNPKSRKAYESWLSDRTLDINWMNGMVDELSRSANETNQKAAEMARDELPRIYAENANHAGYAIDREIGLDTSFALVDESTVRVLMQDDEPPFKIPKIDNAKDRIWNRQQFTNAITQGILQGKSVDGIVESTEHLFGKNEAAAVRAARTAVTGAENAGRVSSYQRAKRLGIKLKQEWLATLDVRTRSSHRQLDGEKIEVGEKFSNGLRFPGDHEGAGSEVYNCRCTLVAAVDGIDQSDAERFNNLPDGMTYEEWKDQARKRMEGELVGEPSAVRAPERHVVEGKDILGTWQRRPDEFDFEIEDVMAAQGFDGKPRIVDADEFDRAVKQANGGDGLVMQRTYTAPDQATLDAYREMLYDGKWYVDCSTGGAQYGQGMYAAADYSGTLSQGIKNEMQHYIDLGVQRNTATTFDMLSEVRQSELIADEVKTLGLAGDRAKAAEAIMRNELQIESLSWNQMVEAHNTLGDVNYMDAVSKLRTYRSDPVHYVETMTLDPRAKIITYDEVVAIKEIGISELDIVKIAKSEDEVAYLRNYIGLDRHDHSREHAVKIRRIEDAMSDVEYDRIRTLGNKLIVEGENRVAQMQDMNEGALAASLGYDAINAVGHGESGSYTVVLNRTKLIIRRPE